jgi:hypothetical protein
LNIGNQIDYVATDEKRQVIPYVHVKDLQGRILLSACVQLGSCPHFCISKNPGSESRCLVIALIIAGERDGLQSHNQQSQPHCELREQVVISNREAEMNAVEEESIHRFDTLRQFRNPLM